MLTIAIVLEVIAFVLFLVAAINVPSSRINLIAAGLAVHVLAALVAALPLR